MSEIIVIHDLEHPDHPGKSYKEVNLEKEHNIPVGELVELDSEDERYANIRLYVVGHHRDCDGTPLYSLGLKGADMWQSEKQKFHNYKTFHGIGEDSLTIVKPNT